MWPYIDWKVHACVERACQTLSRLDGRLPRESNLCVRWSEVMRQCRLELEVKRAEMQSVNTAEVGDKVVRDLLTGDRDCRSDGRT